MPTVKVLRKVAAQLQAGDDFEDNAMFLLPYTGGVLKSMNEPIEDDSIVGTAFKSLPQQGGRSHGGSGMGFNLDSVSCQPLLNGAFATVSGVGTVASPLIYTLGNVNQNRLSVASLDSVKNNKFNSLYIKSFGLESSVSSLVKLTCEMIGLNSLRDNVSTFPAAPTAPGTPFTHHEAGGTNGYVRIGPQTAALDADDNIQVESFSFSIDNGFDNQYSNDGVDTLEPVFGMGTPTVDGAITVSRHDTDQFFTWRDDWTSLQAEIYIYKSATNNIKIQIPNFIADSEPTEDELTKVNLTLNIGRNGVGTSYDNAQMEFTSPIRVTLINQA